MGGTGCTTCASNTAQLGKVTRSGKEGAHVGRTLSLSQLSTSIFVDQTLHTYLNPLLNSDCTEDQWPAFQVCIRHYRNIYSGAK